MRRRPAVLRVAAHVVRLLWETTRFSLATRRWSLLALVVLGMILLLVTATTQTVAPVVLYPFA